MNTSFMRKISRMHRVYRFRGVIGRPALAGWAVVMFLFSAINAMVGLLGNLDYIKQAGARFPFAIDFLFLVFASSYTPFAAATIFVLLFVWSYVRSEWEVRFPGGVYDLRVRPRGGVNQYERFAVAEDVVFVNNSRDPVSLSAELVIRYGNTLLVIEPYSLELPYWSRLVAAFHMRAKPQLLFPLNLEGRTSAEGHVVFPVRLEGQGKGVGGDEPEHRAYTIEIRELLSGKESVVSISALRAPDVGNRYRVVNTDLAIAGPPTDPWEE